MSRPLAPASKHFSVDARTVLALGRDSIKDHTTAILELVKNGYDAGATVVVVEVLSQPTLLDQPFIRIVDNGYGMSESDVETKWLRIGYSEKKRLRRAKARRRVGEKGIGRLSADRLGAILELRSQASGVPAIGLQVNWDLFDRQGKDLISIPLDVLADTSFKVPQVTPYNNRAKSYGETPPSEENNTRRTGTELTISQLRQLWRPTDLDDLHRELSILTSPFGSVKDFQIRLKTDLRPDLDGVVASPFFQAAEIKARFSVDAQSKVHCSIMTRDGRGNVQERDTETVEWRKFVHRTRASSEVQDGSNGPTLHAADVSLADHNLFGPAKVEILFYPRIAETLRGTGLSLGQLKEFLDAHAGMKVYRDNVRVMPYGDPHRAEGGDWLGLGDRKTRNPAGAGRPDFRIAPNQIVGGVFITRDGNPELVDTSGREGLVHREAFDELKAFLYSCLFRLEAHYHKLYVKRRKKQHLLTSPREAVREFGAELRTLREQIQSVKGELPKKAERKFELVQDQLGTTSSKIAKMERSIEELASQATTYRGLASLGIATATFSHETGLALDHFLSCLYAAMNLMKAASPDVDTALIELNKSISAGKRISAWGRFALRRIRPDMRRKRVISVDKTLESLIAELREPFEASQIDLVVRLRDVEARVFPMDIESVALNCLTNAYQFVKIGKRQRRVRLTLAKAKRDGNDGFEIAVADSGPGVSKKIREKIWEPLYSTKLDGKGHAYGTGLGLSIVNDVVNDLGGTREVGRDTELSGALFTIWLPRT